MCSEAAELVPPRWWRVVLRGPAPAVEAMVELLYHAGAQGVEYEDGHPAVAPFTDEAVPPGAPFAAAYFPAEDGFLTRLQTIREVAAREGWGVETESVPSQDWVDAVRREFHPLPIAQGYGVVPAWYDRSPFSPSRTIWIDPGLAFGTGHHPTTMMCLLALVREGARARRVLDLGSGSGILAILAARLGAREVDAVEPDPMAVRALTANIERNHLSDRIRVVAGQLDALPVDRRYEVVTANLMTDLILQLWPQLAARLEGEAGYAILSGIGEVRVGEVERAVEATGFRVLDYRLWQGWAALVVRPR